MNFSESPLKWEADRIVFKGDSSGADQWKFEFKLQEGAPVDLSDPDLAVTGKEQDGFFSPLKLQNIDFVRDYEKAAGEYVNVCLIVPTGMWLKVLFPARKYLTAHITRTKLLKVDGMWDDDTEIKTLVYKVLLKIDDSHTADTNSVMNITRRELDMRGFQTLDLDLIDRGLEQLRNVSIGGTWRQVTPQQVIESVFATESAKVIVDGEKMIDGVEFAKGSTTRQREHIMIEQGTPLLEVPFRIHEHNGGVWPTGINCFFQDRYWYVYPIFDTSRFNQETKTLTIVRVPDRLYSSPEKTLLEEAGRYKIIATSTSKLFDATHAKYLTEGDGVRFADADVVMDGWVQTKDNKAVAKRKQSNTEARIDDPSTPDHFTRVSPSRITSNSMVEFSNLAARKGQIAIFNWENADFTILKPGMMCKILYLKGDDVAELDGVLLNVQASVQLFGEGLASNSYRTTCALFIFCNISEEVKS